MAKLIHTNTVYVFQRPAFNQFLLELKTEWFLLAHSFQPQRMVYISILKVCIGLQQHLADFNCL